MARKYPRKDPVAVAFGRAVRLHRRQLSYTLEDLGGAAGVHPTYVGRVERGLQAPTIPVLFQLSKGLNMEPPKLIETAGQFLTSGR